METNLSLSKTWGIALFTFNHGSISVIQEYPNWINRSQINYSHSPFLVAWDENGNKLVVLSACDTKKLFEKLTENSDWRTTGVLITERALKFSAPIIRKKKNVPEIKRIENMKDQFSSKWIDNVLLELPPSAGYEIIDLLNKNMKQLVDKAEEENKRFCSTIESFYERILVEGRKKEEDDAHFTTRKPHWRKAIDPHHWVCSFENCRGSIRPIGKWGEWIAYVDTQEYTLPSGSVFQKFDEALDWVDSEIERINKLTKIEEYQDPDLLRKKDLDNLHEKVKNYPIQIKPGDLVYDSISFQVLIDIFCHPISMKICDFEFGDTYYCEEKYITPIKLSESLNIDPDLFEIDQPMGENSEWFIFKSLTKYNSKALIESKAQEIWDHSNILHQYKNKNIKIVQFGFTEVESGYSIYLGGCSEDSEFQNQNQTRKEYIKDLAFQKTVYHSLIVQDLRCYLGISNKTITDEDLLYMMHKTRANSKFLSKDEKRKSQHWLLENKISL